MGVSCEAAVVAARADGGRGHRPRLQRLSVDRPGRLEKYGGSAKLRPSFGCACFRGALDRSSDALVGATATEIA